MAKGIAVNGKRLRDLREARMLSQVKLGKRANVATPTVSRLERGFPATPPVLERIATALGVDPEWLLAKTSVDVILEESNGNGHEEPAAVETSAVQNAAPIDLSEASETFMDRIEDGEVEEVREDEKLYFDQLTKLLAEPDDGDLRWGVEGYERNLAQGLAAMARRDREEGAEEIQRVLRRMREVLEG